MIIKILLIMLGYFVLPWDSFLVFTGIMASIIVFPSLLHLVFACLQVFVLYFIALLAIRYIEERKARKQLNESRE